MCLSPFRFLRRCCLICCPQSTKQSAKYNCPHEMQIKALVMAAILTLTAAPTAQAGPIACAACITGAAAVCIGACLPLVPPSPPYLACVLKCEVDASFGPCAAICMAPLP